MPIDYETLKSRKGPWNGPVAMSETQFRKAQAAGDAYWLYIVENVGTAVPTVLHRIQNPAGKARNYCLDPGWAALADPDLFEKSSPQG